MPHRKVEGVLCVLQRAPQKQDKTAVLKAPPVPPAQPASLLTSCAHCRWQLTDEGLRSLSQLVFLKRLQITNCPKLTEQVGRLGHSAL